MGCLGHVNFFGIDMMMSDGTIIEKDPA